MINKVILIGNLGADPETRYSQGGNAVTKFRIATSENWRDRQSGEQQEHGGGAVRAALGDQRGHVQRLLLGVGVGLGRGTCSVFC